MVLICYVVVVRVKLTLYRKRFKKKIKPQRKCTTQSQVLEINYLPIPEIMILGGVLSLVSLRQQHSILNRRNFEVCKLSRDVPPD